MRLLAIDPGPAESAYVIWDGAILQYGKLPNDDIRRLFQERYLTDAVCERIRSYGMPAGAELFETCEWAGRFWDVAYSRGIDWHWLARKDVKINLCGSMKAKDANIRQALIDRLGPPGTKKQPGATYGISGDLWAALAVAVTFSDLRKVGMQ